MDTCGMSFIKYLLFIFNLIFALSGLGIIIAGACVLSDVSDFNHFISNDLLGPPIVLIVAGAIVFIIAFLGCFGAIRESYKMLIAFAVFLIVIFIVEMAVGIAAAIYKADFEEALKQTLRNSLEKYSNPDHGTEKISWDNLQKKLKCCGVESPSDWQSQIIPTSCCTTERMENQETEQHCLENGVGSYMFKTGCYEKLQMKVHSNTKILIGVGIGIAFIEIAGVVLALWLANRIKMEETAK